MLALHRQMNPVPHYLGHSVVREAAVGFLDVLDGHALGHTRQDERHGEPGSANGELAAQKFRIGDDPAEVLERLERTLLHGLIHLPRPYPISPASMDIDPPSTPSTGKAWISIRHPRLPPGRSPLLPAAAPR